MLKDRYINPFPDIAKVNLSLKYYQDMINVTNTDFRDGERKKGREEGLKQKNINIVITMSAGLIG